jgi:serine/threonine protein kinase
MPYIAEGTYGCGFYPHLQCTNRNTIKDAMGKIYSNPVSFEEEKEISELIQSKIDPDNHFTIPYYNSCNTNLNKPRRTDNINKCSHTNLIKRSGVIETEQLMFRYGGVDLKKLTENFATFSDVYIDDYIHLLLPLVSGIVSLQKHKYVHCDIKPPNILYDDKKGRLYLIDFGLLTKLSDIVNQSHVLSFTYPYYPPEFKLYHYINEQIHPNLMPGKISSNFKYYDQTKWFKFLRTHCNIQDTLQESMQALVPEVMQNPAKFQDDFVHDHVRKIDTYSLGITYLEICFILYQENLLRVRNQSLFTEFMTTVIPKMIHFNPYKRDYPEDIHKAINVLVNKHKLPSSPVLKASPVKTKIQTPNIPSPKSKTRSPKNQHGECMKLKRDKIVELLKARNLPTSGTKKVLCERLNAQQKMTISTPDIPSPKSKTPLKRDACMKLKREQIVELLRARHLPVSGTKQVLCDRLNTRSIKTSDLDLEKCKKLRKSVIEKKLEARNLSKAGTKEVLCKRLYEHLHV